MRALRAGSPASVAAAASAPAGAATDVGGATAIEAAGECGDGRCGDWGSRQGTARRQDARREKSLQRSAPTRPRPASARDASASGRRRDRERRGRLEHQSGPCSHGSFAPTAEPGARRLSRRSHGAGRGAFGSSAGAGVEATLGFGAAGGATRVRRGGRVRRVVARSRGSVRRIGRRERCRPPARTCATSRRGATPSFSVVPARRSVGGSTNATNRRVICDVQPTLTSIVTTGSSTAIRVETRTRRSPPSRAALERDANVGGAEPPVADRHFGGDAVAASASRRRRAQT